MSHYKMIDLAMPEEEKDALTAVVTDG